MLKGETFNLQTFTSDAFALFIDRFLNKQSGVMTGCALSNTNNSATIGEGYFVIRGRFLRIITSETVSDISTNGFYSLVCEIDLSKTNTTEVFNQGEIKVVYGASAYPTLTQQDITAGGTVYQYEFARFKVTSGTISDFTDRRTYVDYGQLVTMIQNELETIEQQSDVMLKTGGTATGDFTFTGEVVADNLVNNNFHYYVDEDWFTNYYVMPTLDPSPNPRYFLFTDCNSSNISNRME